VAPLPLDVGAAFLLGRRVDHETGLLEDAPDAVVGDMHTVVAVQDALEGDGVEVMLALGGEDEVGLVRGTLQGRATPPAEAREELSGTAPAPDLADPARGDAVEAGEAVDGDAAST